MSILTIIALILIGLATLAGLGYAWCIWQYTRPPRK